MTFRRRTNEPDEKSGALKMSETDVLWRPSEERVANSRIHHYMQWLEKEKGLSFDGYEPLWRWSVEHLEDFWASIWQYFDIIHSAPYEQVLDRRVMPGAKWFEGSRLNLAEQLFRHQSANSDKPDILSRSELRPLASLSWGELQRQIASVADALRTMGVGPGDRVVAYLPNIPETVIAFFACASIGAIWSSCSPDMGTRSVLDRFRQIDPKVMIAVDGYRYGGKDFDRMPVDDGFGHAGGAR
jgi:acetoacetyl-CoA synthetase